MDYLQHVIRAAEGDRESCAYLVDRFQGMAVSYAFSILRDFHKAEDAAQEAFILLFNNIHKLKEPAAFPAWLKKLVFTCCDRIRRKRRVETPIDEMNETADDKSNPTLLIEERERRTLVESAMSQLNEGQQEVFVLYYSFGRSYSEIAADLGITEAAVAGRMHQGKKKLKNIMLSTMAEYLGGYKMDRQTFTRKIIDEITKPAQPGTFQGSEYVACFASLYRAIEKGREFSQQESYYKFTSVAGINFAAYDNMPTPEYHSFDACAKLSGIDDYVEYTMGYAGYKYIRITKNEQGADYIYERITASLDREIPVLMETQRGWCILTGYDSKRFIYGYDGTFRDKQFFDEEVSEYWNDMFVLRDWHNIMESVVIVTGKQEPTITLKDVLSRIIRIIEKTQEIKFYDSLIEKLADDEYIYSLPKEKQIELCRYILGFSTYYACSRGEMCAGGLSFDTPETDRDLNLAQSVNGYLGCTYDCGWFALRTLGYGMPANIVLNVNDDTLNKFLDSENRRNIISSIKFILFHDYKISCVLKIITGEYISDLERYLTEPKYNIPRDQVGPVEMGPFETEIVTLPDARVSGRFMPISECNKDSDGDVFLVDYLSDQYYNRSVFCGTYADVGMFITDADTYSISGGKYLKITGNLPISIYNIVDSWYDSNGINLDSGKKMIIEKDKNGEFTAYMSLISE